MTIEEKFTGFSYQDNQKYHQKAVEEVWTRVWDKRQGTKVAKTSPQPLSAKFSSLGTKPSSWSACNSGENQEETETKLLQAIRTYGFDCSIEVFGHISKGYVYNPEFKENIDKFGPGYSPVHIQMSLLLTFRQIRNK